MTGLPDARKASTEAATSRSLARPAPSSPPRSRYSALIRLSSAATSIASSRSRSSVSLGRRRRLSATARSSGSPESCSTSGPSGAITSAALSATSGIGRENSAQSAPNMTSSSTRCRTLRSPSRPAQIQFSTRPMVRSIVATRPCRLRGPAPARAPQRAPTAKPTPARAGRGWSLRPFPRCVRPCRSARAGNTASPAAPCRGA